MSDLSNSHRRMSDFNGSTVSTNFQSANDTSSHEGSSNIVNEGPQSYSGIMYDRWQRSNMVSIPQLDQKDIFEQGHFRLPRLNQSPCTITEMHQHHPEFTHSSYKRKRSLEDAFTMSNYLSNLPKTSSIEKLSISQKIANTFNKKLRITRKLYPILYKILTSCKSN